MPKSKQPTVSYAAAADSNKKVKPSPPSGVQGLSASSQESGLHNRTKQTVKSVFQPQSLAMDVQDSTSKSASEPVVMPSLKLYETIERFKQITNQTRQQVVHEFMNNFVDENKNGNVVSVFKTPDSADLRRVRSGTSNRTQTGQQKKLTKRHIISGTGRVAYGGRLDPHSAVSNEEDFEVRVIYRLNKSDNSNHQTSAQQHMEWQDINFGGAEAVPVTTETSVTSSAAASVDFALSERVVQSMVLDPPVESGSDKTDPSSSPVTVNGNSSSSSSSSATNKNNVSTNSRINSNISSGGVKAGGVKTGFSFGNSTGKSFPNTKTPAFQQQASQLHSVGVGVTGLAAARAKMSSLGQDWADEEELPGFSLPKSGTNSLKAGGGVSREVNKEVNKEVQRQQKLKSAKRG